MKIGEILAKFYEILVKFGEIWGGGGKGEASKTRINLFRNIFKNYQLVTYSVTEGLILAASSQLKISQKSLAFGHFWPLIIEKLGFFIASPLVILLGYILGDLAPG